MKMTYPNFGRVFIPVLLNEHKTYLKLWKILKEEDHEISIMFDDFKRSNAIQKLAAWKHNEVISDDLFSKLSSETQQKVISLNELFM